MQTPYLNDLLQEHRVGTWPPSASKAVHSSAGIPTQTADILHHEACVLQCHTSFLTVLDAVEASLPFGSISMPFFHSMGPKITCLRFCDLRRLFLFLQPFLSSHLSWAVIPSSHALSEASANSTSIAMQPYVYCLQGSQKWLTFASQQQQHLKTHSVWGCEVCICDR